MVRNRKPTGRAMSVPAGIGIGVGIAGSLTVIGSLIVAWLLDSGRIGEMGIGYGAMVILVLASVIGSWAAVALVKHRRLLIGMATGAGYLLLLLGVTAFCFGGQYQGIVPTALLTLGGSAAVVVVTNGRANGSRPRRHKTATG